MLGMSPTLRAKMEHWRDHGTATEKAHAAARLAMPDAGSGGSGTIVPPPDPRGFRAWRLVLACPHRSRDAGCGCSGYRCGLGKGRGGLVAHRDCLACVGLPVTG